MQKKGLSMWLIILIGTLFLAAIIFFIFAVLVYLGIFSPKAFISTQGSLPEYATLSVPFYVNYFSIKTSGIVLDIRNAGSANLIINSVEVENCGSSKDLSLTIAPNEIKKISINCALAESSSFKGNIKLTYTREEINLLNTAKGSLKGTVSA